MYRDPSLPIKERVTDLIGRMTVEEKVAQLCGVMPIGLFGASGLDPDKMKAILGNGMGQISMLAAFGHKSPPELARTSNAIQEYLAKKTRLGIPVIIHNEALNGFVAPEAPNFPTAIGLAATWAPELVERMTDLIRRQMRAVGVHQALSPVMDVARDARWGRVHETYGEDPYLCSAMSTAFVKGLQGSDLEKGVIATGKHFLGYGLSEAGQNMAATQIGPRELYETFARPFEAAIRDAGLASIMNSYSEIDGIPVGSSREILTDLLRGTMGFQGFVVSDYNTIRWLVTRQGTASSPREAGIQALTAGLDVELPNKWGYDPPLVEAVQEGLVSEDVLNTAVQRVLEFKFRLGLFENPYVDAGKVQAPYADPENERLSYEMACKSLTLLKNEGTLLPLRKDAGTIAIIGPHADSVSVYFPGYTYPGIAGLMRSGILSQRRDDEGTMAGVQDDMGLDPEAMQAMLAEMVPVLSVNSVDEYVKQHYPAASILEAVRATAEDTEALYAQGCDVKQEIPGGITEAVAAAERADVAILALGGKGGWIGGGTEGEGRDTANVELPGAQRELIQAIVATGTPVVVVLFQGRPYAIPWVAEHVPAILVAYYPGQEGGLAIASALFGDVNPGGKLPVTIPRHSGQVPIYHYHKMGSGYGRAEGDMHTGYTDMPSTPLYPFGHGLSYTTFAYDNLRLSAERVDSRGAIEIACDVTNTGDVPGDEVVQLYLHDREATVTRPVQELAGFKRVGLAPGATCTVTFTVEMRQLGFYDRHMKFVVEPGNVDVMIGSSAADIRLRDAFEITGDTVEVIGNRAFSSQVAVSGQVGIAETSRPKRKPRPRPEPAPVAPAETEPTSDQSPEAGSMGEVLAAIAQRLDGKRPDVTTTLKFDVDGEGIYRLVIEAGKCRLEQGGGEAETTLRMDAKDGVRIMTGKMNPMVAMATGKLKVEGNMQGAMILQSAR